MNAPGPLGLILPDELNQEQRDAHERSLAMIPRFTIQFSEPTGLVKIMLTDAWKHPDCVADMGQVFTGFGQFTGSCVGVSEGDAVTTVSCIQRLVADKPTKAFICWWPFAYGRTRQNEGDRGQGEGADDAVMGTTLVSEGFFDITAPGLPAFTRKDADGFWLSKQIELQWSNNVGQQWRDLAKPQAGMTKAIVNDVAGIRAAIINGYAILDGCSMYIGSGSLAGSGANTYVVGHYNGNGGHSTCYLGYWDHPNDGPLYLYSNQWATSTYPKDPAGAGRCCVWVKETEVAKLFRLGGNNGQTMALSNMPWFPAQPKVQQVLSYFQ